jgi:hypothetical protein
MLKTVSKETLNLYWNIGKSVSQKINQEKWGTSIVERLAKDLQSEFPGIRGFSARNIWRMKTLYDYYEDKSKLTPLVAEIGWVQNCLIIITLRLVAVRAELGLVPEEKRKKI